MQICTKHQFTAVTAPLGKLIGIGSMRQETVEEGQGPGDSNTGQDWDHKVVKGCVIISLVMA